MSRIVSRPATRIAGFSTRTTHARAGLDIGPLWGRASAEGVLGSNSQPVAAYYDYDPDSDAYTALIGVELQPDQAAPEGLEVVEVPAQTCLVDEAPAEIAAVGAWWSGLWQRWPDGGPRRLAVDLERWMGGMGPEHRVQFEIGVHADRMQ